MMKIYCCKYQPILYPMLIHVVAVCGDGVIVADHLCSDADYMRGDLGVDTASKHELYDAYCGVGNWELEWVDDDEIDTHPGFLAALAKYHERREEEERQ